VSSSDASRAHTPIELDDFDFALPRESIAQLPLPERDASRLLCLDRASGALRHETIRALPELLAPGDLLVMNATRVLPARLRGRRESGGAAEALLLGPEPTARGCYRALLRLSGRLRAGIKLTFSLTCSDSGSGSGPDDGEDEASEVTLEAEISELHEGGEVTLVFAEGADPYAVGRPPLPPYVERNGDIAERNNLDRERYQTVFARVPGAVAAPTAGLHLTRELLDAIEARGVACAEVILHVGLGTFRPLRDEELHAGRLHAERFELPEETARAVAATRRRGGRVVAVGTTTTRVLESQARDDRSVAAGNGETQLFLKPGDRFRVVDALLTNFHLPRSSLLLLVAAFAGREPVLNAYRQAVAEGYRFYSYGDAMWIS
jgi:S-adenosylmethionine:tRNA ribosyltransferase-isomerase